MWRLIAFIIIFAVFLAFIVFNLENKCDVSFGLVSFEGIPVFLTAFFSFVLGMCFAVPFVLSFGKKRKKDPPNNDLSSPPPSSSPGEDQAMSPMKRWASKKRSSREPVADETSTASLKEADPKEAEKIERDEAFKLADQIKRENSINGFF